VDDDLRRRIAAIVGNAGVGPGSDVHPSSLEQLREVMSTCGAAGAELAPAGSSRAVRADVVVSASRLNSIRLNAGALLLHAGAAAAWTAVREAAGARRLGVTGLPSLRGERVGDSIAAGEIARRAVAGIDLLTPQGELISAGGRTLKDVVGYDLPGLALGSGERLGLVVAATLRLEPDGARTPSDAGPGPWRGLAGIDIEAAFTG
jgi:glycolate oxidase